MKLCASRLFQDKNARYSRHTDPKPKLVLSVVRSARRFPCKASTLRSDHFPISLVAVRSFFACFTIGAGLIPKGRRIATRFTWSKTASTASATLAIFFCRSLAMLQVLFFGAFLRSHPGHCKQLVHHTDRCHRHCTNISTNTAPSCTLYAYVHCSHRASVWHAVSIQLVVSMGFLCPWTRLGRTTLVINLVVCLHVKAQSTGGVSLRRSTT